jgi:chromosome transmission fidelity protein 18
VKQTILKVCYQVMRIDENILNAPETPLRPRLKSDNFPPPSSPPNSKMPSASSPITYPPSSSPPVVKRPLPVKPADLRRPKTCSGFLLDEDSDGEDDFSLAEPAPKRRMLDDQHFQHTEFDDNDEGNSGEIQTPANEPTMRTSLIEGNPALDEQVNEQPHVTASFSVPAVDLAEVQVQTVALPSFLDNRLAKSVEVVTYAGKSASIQQRRKAVPIPFEQLVAARSTTKAGRAKKTYYGIDIHQLIDEASRESGKDKARRAKASEEVLPSVEHSTTKLKSRKTLMWTEKYRARNFMELVGDDRTHRQVLRWLKAWDPIVFPTSGKAKLVASIRPGEEADEEKAHRKILLLTGPPGLGKTTLAHVCARQAGYEVMEINASDERSRDIVKGRIRTSVGTESVKTGSTVTTKAGHVQKIAHPLCVVVDEVDGVVGGSSGSGEGGFIKALIDLILLDQKNSSAIGASAGYATRKKKGDDFRLMRPLILICNDIYHPSLRPLRQSSFAEIIHVRKPPLDAVVTRMKSVFEKEGVSCDGDAVRRLCEATWGVSAMESRKGKEGTGEGDLRGIMVVGEWAAGKLKATKGSARLTRKWVEDNMTSDLSHGGGGARGVGRGGAKEVVNRVFLESAGFPNPAAFNPLPDASDNEPKTQLGVAELAKRAGMDRLREMVDTSGDIDRIVTDIFSQYPRQPFNDDSILSKPDAAYEWLYFHDTCSSRVFSGQEFELASYLSQPVLACHHLFSSPARHYFGGANESKRWGDEEEVEEPLPFSGPRADYEAHEAEKFNRATLLTLQANLNAMLLRSFRSPEDIATDLLPYLVRLLTPEIKPIIVGGSGDQKGIASVRKETEKAMVKRAVDVMGGVGVTFERGKLEGDFGYKATQWIYRMEP